MRWPWQRQTRLAAERAEEELREVQRRFWRAVGDAPHVDRRAAELARELSAGELYARLARALNREQT